MARYGFIVIVIALFGIFSSVNSSDVKVAQDVHLEDLNVTESENNCDNALSCLNLRVFMNVSKIMEQDEFKLSDNLALEKYADVVESDEAEARQQVTKKMNSVTTVKMMKKVMDLFKTHALKYKVMKGLDVAVFRKVEDGQEKISVGLVTDEPQRGARTFGVAIFRKRMMYILLAMTFKLGVIKTLLVTLLVLVLKGISIGVVLLVLAFSSTFAKWKLSGLEHGGHITDHKQGIHVHLHSDPHKLAYSGYALPEEEQHPAYHHGFHRRKEDADVGYPAVFRPPIYKQPPTVAPIPVYQVKGGPYGALPPAQYGALPTAQYGVAGSSSAAYGVIANPNSQYGIVSNPTSQYSVLPSPSPLRRYEYPEEQPQYSNIYKRSSEEYQPVFEYQGYEVEERPEYGNRRHGYSDVREYKGLGYEVEEQRGDERKGDVKGYKGLGYEVEERREEDQEITKRSGYRMEDQPEFAAMFNKKQK